MEKISELLQPYKEVIGKSAGAVTFIQFLSGAVVCNDIRKKKSTAGFSIIPFLGGMILCVLSLKFGSILQDDAMIQINFLGVAMNIIYLTIFYWFTRGKDKTDVWLKLGFGGAIIIGLLAYAQFEDDNVIEYRFGLIITILLIALVASPFLNLREIIRTQSTESLPFPIIVSGTLVAFSWFLYGLCLNNSVIIVQNLILLILSIIQLSLFVIYPSTSSTIKKSIKSKAKSRGKPDKKKNN